MERQTQQPQQQQQQTNTPSQMESQAAVAVTREQRLQNERSLIPSPQELMRQRLVGEHKMIYDQTV